MDRPPILAAELRHSFTCDRLSSPSSQAKILTEYPTPIPFADTFLPAHRIHQDVPLPSYMHSDDREKLKIMFFNGDTSGLAEPLSSPTHLRHIVDENKPDLLGFAETVGQNPPDIPEMVPVALDPWLDDSTGAGMIIYIRQKYLDSCLVRREARMCGFELDLSQAKVAVFMLYIPPGRRMLAQNALDRIQERLDLRQVQGYHCILLGDLNALHPLHCTPERRTAAYNTTIHPWIRENLLTPVPLGTFHVDPPEGSELDLPRVLHEVQANDPFTYAKRTRAGTVCRSLLDWPLFMPGNAYHLECPTFDIFLGKFPGSHLPITTEVDISQNCADPRLHPTRVYRKWTPRDSRTLQSCGNGFYQSSIKLSQTLRMPQPLTKRRGTLTHTRFSNGPLISWPPRRGRAKHTKSPLTPSYSNIQWEQRSSLLATSSRPSSRET